MGVIGVIIVLIIYFTTRNISLFVIMQVAFFMMLSGKALSVLHTSCKMASRMGCQILDIAYATFLQELPKLQAISNTVPWRKKLWTNNAKQQARRNWKFCRISPLDGTLHSLCCRASSNSRVLSAESFPNAKFKGAWPYSHRVAAVVGFCRCSAITGSCQHFSLWQSVCDPVHGAANGHCIGQKDVTTNCKRQGTNPCPEDRAVKES